MSRLHKLLEIKHLRLIKAIVQHGNLSLAAKELNLTQSALSHQLKNLEAYCDQALFYRHGKKMVPTAAGERILASCEPVFSELDSLASDIQGLSSGTKGRIKLSSECYTSYHWLPKVIRKFEKDFPMVLVEVSTPVSSSLLDHLDKGLIDIAVMMYPGPKRFQSTPLFKDELIVLAHPNNNLSKQKSIQVPQLLNENLIVYSHGKEKLLDLVFGKNNERPNKVTEMPLTEGILEWCLANMGIAIMARWAATRYIDNNELVPLTIDAVNTHRTWYALTLNQDVPEYLKSFLERLSQIAPNLD